MTIKKILLLSSLIMLSTTAAYASDKSKFCPKVEQIHITLTKPYRYILSAYNSDGKYFVSEEQIYDDKNGPAPPVEFIKDLTEYKKPKLTCVYIAFHKYNIHPALINDGDYSEEDE